MLWKMIKCYLNKNNAIFVRAEALPSQRMSMRHSEPKELEVSGIDYYQLNGKYIKASSWQTSENSLRTEHKLPWRLKYETTVIKY